MPSTIAPSDRAPVEIEDRVSFTPAQRRAVLAAGGGICDRCDCDLTNQPFEIDHVLARALGGKHEPSNWVPICSPCHLIKTAQDRRRIAKAKRLERTRKGEKPRFHRPLQGRGFRKDPLRTP